MFDFNNIVSSIIYKVSDKVLEFNKPTINYHPQNIENYTQTILPSNLEIREFVLENKKDLVEEMIKKFINFKDKQQEKSQDVVKNFLKLFPSKAFVIKTDHSINILRQYDKIKQELQSNDLSSIKPGSLLYLAISTAYNIERTVISWQESIKDDKFFDKIKIDLLGKDSFKGFTENAAYIPYSNTLAFGSFLSYINQQIINATQDTDTVIHELGHAILDRIRSKYIDNAFHLESNAIHEAFSDINAFLLAAMDKNISVDLNSLDKPNQISSIGEYFGKHIYSQLNVEKQVFDNFNVDLDNSVVNKPIRDLSKLVDYKPYKDLADSEKEEHKYSLPLSTAFYNAFYRYAQSIGDITEAARKFFKIFTYGTVISPVASASLPEFYKSFVIADILYNNSELSGFLISAAKQNKLLSDSIEKIKQEIDDSRKLDISSLKPVIDESIKSSDTKALSQEILKLLQNLYPEFTYIKDIQISILPGINGNINIEGVYNYPIGLVSNNKEIPVYGGILLVLDKDLNLVYSNIEKPSLEKLSIMKDYLVLKNKNKRDDF